jgi:protein required for attachment to host cells
MTTGIEGDCDMIWPPIGRGSWILVGDGHHAVAFANEGDAMNLRLVRVLERRRDVARSHQLGADRPGRSFSSTTPRRSAYESGDLHLAEKMEFIAEVTAEINAAADSAAFDRLVLVAPSGAIKAYRDHLSPKARNAIFAELQKDLVKHSVASITEHLHAASTAND